MSYTTKTCNPGGFTSPAAMRANVRVGSQAEILDRSTKCPLYPRKRNSPRTIAMSALMSAKCH
jgi:hypothetical protein